MPAAQPQQYDPTSPTPYVAPDAVPVPKESPFGGQPAPTPQGSVTHGGAIAGVFDGLLRGFVNGYAQGEQHKALTLKKKQDDLTASYNADAKRAYDVAQSQIAATGKVDPNSEDYKQAKAAVDGSWGALQDFRGQLLQGQQGKKKGKQDAGRSPAEIMADPKSTPQEKAYVVFQMSSKAGPPIFGQIQTLASRAASPQAQAQFQTQGTQAQADSVHASNLLTHEQALAVHNKYGGMSPDELSKQPPEIQKQVRDADAILNPPPPNKGSLDQQKAAIAKKIVDDPEYKPTDAEKLVLNGGKAPAAVHGQQAWKKVGSKIVAVRIDPATGQEIPGSEDASLVPPASLVGHISTGFYHWVDADGNVHQQQETHSTSPMTGAGGGASSAVPTVTPASATAGVPSATASAGPTRRTKPDRGPATSDDFVRAAGGPKGDKVLGYKGTPEYVKAKELSDTLDTSFRTSVQRMKNPTPIGDTGIVFDWVRSQVAGAGRMTNTEIQQALKSGSMGTKFANAYDRATKGTVDPTFRRQMVNDIGVAAAEAKRTANAYRSGGTVKMKAPGPHGQVSDVPADQVAHYESRGATVVVQ